MTEAVEDVEEKGCHFLGGKVVFGKGGKEDGFIPPLKLKATGFLRVLVWERRCLWLRERQRIEQMAGGKQTKSLNDMRVAAHKSNHVDDT